MLRDLAKGKDAQIKAVTALIQHAQPDILLLTKVDVDAGGHTLTALKQAFGYPHGFTAMPNASLYAPADMDGDGYTDPRGERMAWTRFSGEGTMVLLSRVPLDIENMWMANALLWKNLPDAQLPRNPDDTAYFSETALDHLKLVSQGLWVIPTEAATLILFQNISPVFDGVEDRNGLRNRDQLRLLEQVLDSRHTPLPSKPFVLMGNTNLDPHAGEGDRQAIAKFLARPDLQDPIPRAPSGHPQTAFWEKPGPMRVSYILPSRDWQITDHGVLSPENGPLRKTAEKASRHRLVWMDLRQLAP